MYVCMYACMYVCLYVCVYIYIYIYVYPPAPEGHPAVEREGIKLPICNLCSPVVLQSVAGSPVVLQFGACSL